MPPAIVSRPRASVTYAVMRSVGPVCDRPCMRPPLYATARMRPPVCDRPHATVLRATAAWPLLSRTPEAAVGDIGEMVQGAGFEPA